MEEILLNGPVLMTYLLVPPPALLFYSTLRYSKAFLYIHPGLLISIILLLRHLGDKNSHSSHICDLFLTYLKLWLHIKDYHCARQWELQRHSECVWFQYIIQDSLLYIFPQSEVNWAASLYDCRDVPSQPKWKKYRQSETSCSQMVIKNSLRICCVNAVQKKLEYSLCGFNYWPWNVFTFQSC